MKYRRPENQDLIRDRIIRVKTELRRLHLELRLSEAERRDRERMRQATKPRKAPVATAAHKQIEPATTGTKWQAQNPRTEQNA